MYPKRNYKFHKKCSSGKCINSIGFLLEISIGLSLKKIYLFSGTIKPKIIF